MTKTQVINHEYAFWTEEKARSLQLLWEVGEPVVSIARKIGMSPNSVIGKADRLKLKRRHKEKKESKPKNSKSPWHKKSGKNEAPAPWYIPKETLPLKGSKPKSLFDLKNNECRWPFGVAPDMKFCGERTEAGKSYCSEHHTVSIMARQSKMDLRVVDIPDGCHEEE